MLDKPTKRFMLEMFLFILVVVFVVLLFTGIYAIGWECVKEIERIRELLRNKQ